MNRSKKNLLLTFAMLVVGSFALNAQATYYHNPTPPEDCCEGKTKILVEDFEGYSYDFYTEEYVPYPQYPWYTRERTVYVDFPDQKPSGDPVRLGIPTMGEVADGGAKTKWYATEFSGNSGDLLEDVAVQRRGGGSNNTHTGRVGDNAGMLFTFDASNYENLTLQFDWRTFDAGSSDKFKVYYMLGGVEDLDNDCIVDVDLGDGNWTKILNEYAEDDWNEFCYDFDSSADGQLITVLFRMDGNDDEDFAKFDNIFFCGDEKPMDTPEIPAPAALPAGLALLGLAMARRNRKNG